MPGIKIARGTDPFKKYWWVILLGFGAVGGWVCLPVLDSPGAGAAGSASQESGLKTADQSLDSQDNPSGAQGSAVDMAMPGARKKADGPQPTSSLYRAPGDSSAVAASGAIVTPGTTFADALRDITRASAAKAAVAAAAGAKGGWKEAPQRGFTAPKANFGAMSGFGSGSGSGATVSAGGGLSASSSFGAKGPNAGVSFAKGLKDDSADEAASGKGGVMRSLQSARAVSISAAGAGSADAARGASGAAFDGNASGGRVVGNGAAVGGTGGVYGSLDSAPINLKANNPDYLNQSKIEPPPKPTPMPAQPDTMKQMMMQMMMSVAMAGVMALL